MLAEENVVRRDILLQSRQWHNDRGGENPPAPFSRQLERVRTVTGDANGRMWILQRLGHHLHISVLVVLAFVRKRVRGPGQQHHVEGLEKSSPTLVEWYIIAREMEWDRAPSGAIFQTAIAENVKGRGVLGIAQGMMQRQEIHCDAQANAVRALCQCTGDQQR